MNVAAPLPSLGSLREGYHALVVGASGASGRRDLRR